MTSEKIGRYEKGAEIGHGGMASVYRAFDPHFQREVAIKILPREFLREPSVHARFIQEAEMIAALEHPAIVPVYDYGEENGQPFIVMRLMTGGSLADRLAAGPLSLTDTARMVEQLAPALDRAHAKGIVHCDLKPGNILFDGEGSPYISDFGIAKVVTSTSSNSAMPGKMVGTPNYMSPEQARVLTNIDGRSDIYSLGVVIFESLAGKLPYEAATPVGMIIKHLTEPPPSICLLNPKLPPECDSLIQRAMAIETRERFNKVSELAHSLSDIAGLSPAASDEPSKISVADAGGPPSTPPATTLGRTLPAHIATALPKTNDAKPRPRRWLWALSTAVVVVIIGLASATALIHGQAPAAVVPIVQTANSTPTLTVTTAPSPTPLPTQLPTPIPYVAIVPENAHSIVQLAQYGKGAIGNMAWSHDGAKLAVATAFGLYLYDGTTFEQIKYISIDTFPEYIAFSADGNGIVSAGRGITAESLVQTWNLSGTLINQVTFKNNENVLALSPDGRLALADVYSPTYTLGLYDAQTGDSLKTLGSSASYEAVFSPKGDRIAALSSTGDTYSIVMWDVMSGVPLHTITETSELNGMRFSPSGKLFMYTKYATTSSQYPTIVVWDATTGQMIKSLEANGLAGFDKDDSLAFVAQDGKLQIVDLDNCCGTPIAHALQGLDLQKYIVSGMTFAPGGLRHRFAVQDSGRAIHVWDADSGMQLHVIDGYTLGGTVALGAYNADSALFFSDGGAIREQQLLSGNVINAFELAETLSQPPRLAVSPNGHMLAAQYFGQDGAHVLLWNTSTNERAELRSATLGGEAIAFSPDSKLVGVAGGTIQLFDANTHQLVKTLGGPGGAESVSFSTDGRLVAGESRYLGSSTVWETSSGRILESVIGVAPAFQPNTHTLATTQSSSPAGIFFWDADTGKPLRSLGSSSSFSFPKFVFDATGGLMAVTQGSAIEIWSAQDGRRLAVLQGHRGEALSMAFSLDGAFLVSSGSDGTTRVWGLPRP